MNEKYLKLDPAPIAEAIFCVDMAGTPPLIPARLPDLMSAMDNAYVKESDILVKTMTFNLQKDGETVTPLQQTSGVRFKKEKVHVIGLSNLDQQVVRFGYSRLKPYASWDGFITEAKRMFGRFLEVRKCDPVVKRIGVRFINVLPVDAERCKMSDVLYSVPVDPKGITNINIDDFFYRDTAYYSDFDLKATVIRASSKDPNGKLLAIYDADIFTNPELENSKLQLDELLDRVHALKNALFFGGVSEIWYKKYKHETK